ncbi:MAG: hypothetical protein JWO86_4569 [Myxococcaceae bacterium]|nr:hypothetical protein [Myxococcaceae bacterium]MEA2752390.1 hypothetical protein [Myxococcales bacterium]
MTPPTAKTAPTWTPQSAQEKWSDRSGRGNFIKAWGVSSPTPSGRVMPKPYGARYEGIQRDPRGILPLTVNLDVCRIELGPSRRDPQGTLQNRNRSGAFKNALQGASAMGSFAVTRRVSRRVSERRPTAFDFGVRVATRWAHANRACMQSAFILNAVCTHASNHQREHRASSRPMTRRCSLQKGLPVSRSSIEVHVHSAAHGVHG